MKLIVAIKAKRNFKKYLRRLGLTIEERLRRQMKCAITFGVKVCHERYHDGEECVAKEMLVKFLVRTSCAFNFRDAIITYIDKMLEIKRKLMGVLESIGCKHVAMEDVWREERDKMLGVYAKRKNTKKMI